MKKYLSVVVLGSVAIMAGAALVPVSASSHREAPLISQDPLADNTDLYAFVSPTSQDKVTIIANFIPLEAPYGGPNFYKFDDNVLYEIKIDNNGDAREDVTFQFRFKTTVRNPNTFLYNTGPITSLDSPDWNVRQSYSVTSVDGLEWQPLHRARIEPADAAREHRPPLHAELRGARGRGRASNCPEASRCSPASATIRSSWI